MPLDLNRLKQSLALVGLGFEALGFRVQGLRFRVFPLAGRVREARHHCLEAFGSIHEDCRQLSFMSPKDPRFCYGGYFPKP